MTDQIPADKVREIIARHRDGASHRGGMILNDLKALLPLPTLADMAEEDRTACQWMQADVADHNTRYVIANPLDDNDTVALIAPDGGICWVFPEYVTPRPDLPRMEWPGTEKPAPALPEGWRLADHRKYGRVIVTNPNQESDGYSYCIFSSDMDSTGFDWHPCAPDALTYIDQEGDTTTGPGHLAVGTVIESADDPRLAALPYGSILGDRDGGPFDITKTGTGEWAGPGYVPAQGTGTKWGPWTVRRIGREADQ